MAAAAVVAGDLLDVHLAAAAQRYLLRAVLPLADQPHRGGPLLANRPAALPLGVVAGGFLMPAPAVVAGVLLDAPLAAAAQRSLLRAAPPPADQRHRLYPGDRTQGGRHAEGIAAQPR